MDVRTATRQARNHLWRKAKKGATEEEKEKDKEGTLTAEEKNALLERVLNGKQQREFAALEETLAQLATKEESEAKRRRKLKAEPTDPAEKPGEKPAEKPGEKPAEPGEKEEKR